MPDSLLQIDQRPKVRGPVRVSNESIECIRNSAQWVENKNLQRALQSLARQLKNSNAGK